MRTDEQLGGYEAPVTGVEAPKESVETPAEEVDVLGRLIPDVKEARKRLDLTKENDEYEALNKELLEIEKLEGEALLTALFEFRSSHVDLLLTDSEKEQLQAQAVEKMTLWDKDADGIPDSLELDSGEETDEYSPYLMESNYDENENDIPDSIELPEEDMMEAFLESNRLQTPGNLAAEIQRLWTSSNAQDFSDGERFTVTALKNEAGLKLEFFDTKFDSEAEPSAEWVKYKAEVQEALKTVDLEGVAKQIEAEEGKEEQDLMVITFQAEEDDGFKERAVEIMEEAEGVLTEEGVLQDGNLPNAATRFDGSMETEEEMQDTIEKVREAMDGKKWIEAAMLFLKFLGLKFSSLFSGFGGGPVSGEEGEPQSLEEIDPKLSLSELSKYDSTREILDNISDPGARVAAAAVLGVRKDTKADHCSDWVDTVCKTVHRSGRYYNTQNAYVNPGISKYRGWANRSKNKVSFSEANFKPGDMVIARSSGSPTGFHDQIVIDTDPEKGVLVASQERLNRRALRWKRFTEDDVAVISRPGWTGPAAPPSQLYS